MKKNRESSFKQRQLIAIGCGKLAISKDDKEAMLLSRYGKSSTTELTFAQAEEVIDDLRDKDFVITSKKRPYMKRRKPFTGGHSKRTGKTVALASQAELAKIDALAGLITWKAENGMVWWMKNRFKIDKVKTSHDAFMVIEGLKGMFENQMKKEHGPDWWRRPHGDIEIRHYIAEHFPG